MFGRRRSLLLGLSAFGAVSLGVLFIDAAWQLAAIRAYAASTSSAVVASPKVSGWAAMIRLAVSICSKVAWTASSGVRLAGT